jgi:hypothetical protein
MARVARAGQLNLMRRLVFMQDCDPCQATRGVTPLVAALRERQAEEAMWLVRNGAVTELIASVKASPTGRGGAIARPLYDALFEARDGDVLAAFVCQIEAERIRFPGR